MNSEVLKALRHPLRIAMLEAMKKEAASVGSLARILDVGLGNAVYHLTVLESAGLVEEGDAGFQFRGA